QYHSACGTGQGLLVWRTRVPGVRCCDFLRSMSCCVNGRAVPREVDHNADSPAIEDALWGGMLLQPANGCQVLSGGFDVAHVEPNDVGNPGAFTETARMKLAVGVIEAAEQMAEYRGDARAAAPASDQAQRLAGHGDAPVRVGKGLEHSGNLGVVR